MANNVGNISIGLSLDNQTFEAVLSGTASRIKRFEADVGRAGAAAAGASGGFGQFGSQLGKLSPALTSVSFGAGDFISQLGTRGLGGGLQAAANNIQQLGAAFGPMGLAVSAGVGVAATALGVFIEQSDKAKKAQKTLAEESAAAWKKIAADASASAESVRDSIRKSRGEVSDINAGRDVPSTHAEFKSQIAKEEARLRELQTQRQGLLAELNRALPNGITGQVRGGQFAQRAGVDVPGMGIVAIGDATLNTGPLTMRALGKTANATRIDPKTGEKLPFFSKETIAKIGDIEKRLIQANEDIRATVARGEAMARKEPQVLKAERTELDRKNRLAELQQQDKAMKADGLAQTKGETQAESRAKSLSQSFETFQEKMQRQLSEVDTLQRDGALSKESADTLRARIEGQGRKQLASLPSFEAGSRETLTAINRAIRGTQDTKVVEKNTAETATAAKKLVGKMEDVRRTLSENRFQVARF